MTGLAATTHTRHQGDPAALNLPKLALLGLKPHGLLSADDPVSGSLARLRAMVPKRPLGWREAEQVAERQADRLRSQLGVLGPQLKEIAVAALPWLSITRHETFPTAGALTKTDYGWIIVLRSADLMVRQRFTLAHELKHLLDDELIARLPGELYPSTGGYSAHERTERVCDRFAAALLMPRILLRADWADGLQDIAKLARRYDVSWAAMRVRLSQLGLLEPSARCLGGPTIDTATRGTRPDDLQA